MNERTLYFSPARGGVVCRNCEAGLPDRMQVDPRLISIGMTLARLPRENGVAVRLPRLSRAQTDPLQAIFAGHLEHNVGKPFRMTRHILPTRRQVVSRPVTMLRREANALPLSLGEGRGEGVRQREHDSQSPSPHPDPLPDGEGTVPAFVPSQATP